MADLFDPTQAQKTLEAAFGKTQKSRGSLEQSLIQTQEKVTNINRSFANDLNMFATQTDRISDAALGALDNLDKIDSNPAVVSRIMGIFDESYNRSVQERKLQRAQYETMRLSNQIKTKDDLRSLQLQEASQDLQLAEQMYQFDQQGFLDQSNLIQLGFQVEAQIDKRTLDAAKNASIEDLTAWRKDPSKAPGLLRNKPGLIDTVWTDRKMAEQGLSDATDIAAIRRFEIQRMSQQAIINGMDDKTLATAIKTNQLPEGLPYNVANDEWERRQAVDYSLMAAERAKAVGDIEVEINAKQNALRKMTTQQIQMLTQLSGESPDGSVQAGSITFTQQELTDAYNAAYNRDLAVQQARNDMIVGAAGIDGSISKANDGVNALAAGVNPGGIYTENAVDSLTPQMRSEVLTLQQQIATALSLPGGATTAAKKIDELNVKIADYQKTVIESQPKEQQPAYREYMEKQTIDNPEAAGAYLAQALPNPTVLAQDLTMGPIWEMYSNAYLEISGQNITSLNVGADDSGLTIAKTDKPNDVDVLEKAAKKVRDQAQGVLFQSFAAETILRQQKQFEAQIARQGTDFGGPAQNIWAGIVNPNTLTFNESIYDTSSGQRIFDFGRFSQYLAAKTQVLRAKGVLQPGESLNQILENTMRTNISGFVGETTFGSIEKAALNKSLFGNNMSYYVGQAVNDFGAYTNTTLSVASERSVEIEREISGLTRDPSTTTGAIMRKGLLPSSAHPGQTVAPSPRPQEQFLENPGDQLLYEYLGGNR